MSPDNPYESPQAKSASQQDEKQITPEHAAYNVVSDTVIGLNVRKSDNRFQAKFVFGSVAAFALIGSILAAVNKRSGIPWYGGALIGTFIGLVFGVFASGIFLMIYRAARHMQGKHE